jgi:septum site-determining protein MinD
MIQQNDMMSVEDVQGMIQIPLLGVIPEDRNVIISTNRGEPLVSQKDVSLAGIAYENAARRLIGARDFIVDVANPYLGFYARFRKLFGFNLNRGGKNGSE